MKTSMLKSVYTLKDMALARGTQIRNIERQTSQWRGWEFRQADSKWGTKRTTTDLKKTPAPFRKSPSTNFLG